MTGDRSDGDAAPERDPAHVARAPEHEIAGHISLCRPTGHRRLERQAARHRDGRGNGQVRARGLRGQPEHGHLPLSGAAARVVEPDRARDGLPACEQPERHAARHREDERPVGCNQADDAAALDDRSRALTAQAQAVHAGLHERRLHLRDRPRGMALQEQRGRAGNVRRGHARPRPASPALRDVEVLDAGSGDVGLQP